MQRKLWLNLLLLGVIAGLVAIAWLEPGKEEAKTQFLSELDENAVERITLKNKEVLVFEKRDGRWWLAEPFKAPANEIRIRQLMDIAKSESEAQYPLKPEEAGKFGLDSPVAELTLGKLHLRFGGNEPIDMRRYVALGDTLHLVTDDFSHHLTAPATDFVEKKLLPEEGTINALFLPGLKANKGGDGKWVIEPPNAPSEGMDDLLNHWMQARAIDVRRLPQAPAGDIVRIGFADRPAVEFVIIQREPDLLLARPDWGLQYQVSGESAKHLLSLQKPEMPPTGGSKSGGEIGDETQDVEPEDMESVEDEDEAPGQE